MVHVLHEGTAESYLKSFGQDFVRFFVNFGFYKIIRVAGRTFRDFLFAIDQLHDSNRYTFPKMNQPLFLVTDEAETGATLVYKWVTRMRLWLHWRSLVEYSHLFRSIRKGFTPYAMGGVIGAAKILFQEDINIEVVHDSSTKECKRVLLVPLSCRYVRSPADAHIVFWVQFDNKRYQAKPLISFPSLPNVRGGTLFQVVKKFLPLSCGPHCTVYRLGVSIFHPHQFFTKHPSLGSTCDQSISCQYATDRPASWRSLPTHSTRDPGRMGKGHCLTFTLTFILILRVDPLLWPSLCLSDGESTATSGWNIRKDSTERANEVSAKPEHAVVSVSSSVSVFAVKKGSSTEKGGYCSLGSADDMISAGLHLNDLNLFDSTSDLLITAMQQERAIEEAIETVSDNSACILFWWESRCGWSPALMAFSERL